MFRATQSIPLFAEPTLQREAELLETVILIGEEYDIIDDLTHPHWIHVRTSLGGYEAYMERRLHSYGDIQGLPELTHRVIVPQATLYASPPCHKECCATLPMNSLLVLSRSMKHPSGTLYPVPGIGWIKEEDIAPISDVPSDMASVVEQFLDMRYVWGDRGVNGIDCSGLILAPLIRVGYKDPPRQKSADIAETVGTQLFHVHKEPHMPALQRDDIVCFDGHVGMMVSETEIIHANAFHQCVTREPLQIVIDRRREAGKSGVTCVRRV